MSSPLQSLIDAQPPDTILIRAGYSAIWRKAAGPRSGRWVCDRERNVGWIDNEDVCRILEDLDTRSWSFS